MDRLDAAAVLEFWFGSSAYDASIYAAREALWFGAEPSVDECVRTRFAEHVERAARGDYADWQRDPAGALALVLLLDQFPRHLHRGTAAAYAFDAQARRICVEALGRGLERELKPWERVFLYLPLQHAEDAADQRRCVELFERELDDEQLPSWYRPHAERGVRIARHHEQIIARYGRYPHRNAALGRPDTLGERMYLDAGGSAFGQSNRPSSAPGRVFRMAGPGLDPTRTVCVDGYVPGYRCLSHWPGSDPPAHLLRDTSTAMALAYARLSPDERREVLGSFDTVINDHYDTDGVLAAFALLEPETALAHRDLMTRAAALGDFRTWQGEDALAVDLSVRGLLLSNRSPLAAILGTCETYEQRAALCYAHMLERIGAVLNDPFGLRHVWDEQFTRVVADLQRVRMGQSVEVQRWPEDDLVVVRSDGPLSRIALVHAAGPAYRVLLAIPTAGGFRYRFLYRNESWFLGIRDRIAPRIPLDPCVAELQRLEPASAGRWWCTPIDRTAPQLGFGSPSDAADVFGDLRPELDARSELPIDTVVDTLLATLRNAARPAPTALETQP